MLNDISAYESSNLPVTSTTQILQPLDTPVRADTSYVEITTLFAEGIRQGIESLFPLPTVDTVSRTRLGDIDGHLADISGQLSTILENLSTRESSSTEGVSGISSVDKSSQEAKEVEELRSETAKVEAKNQKQQTDNHRLTAESFKKMLGTAEQALRNPFNLIGLGIDALLGRKKKTSNNTTPNNHVLVNEPDLASLDEGQASAFAEQLDQAGVPSFLQAPIVSLSEAMHQSANQFGVADGVPFEISDDTSSTVVGSNDEQQHFMAVQMESSQAITDTFNNPEDSEFVNYIASGQTADQATDLGMIALAGLLGVILAPFMGDIIQAVVPILTAIGSSITRIVNYLTGPFHTDILVPLYNRVLLPLGESIIRVLTAIEPALIQTFNLLMPAIAHVLSDYVLPAAGIIISALGDLFVNVLNLLSDLLTATVSTTIYLLDKLSTLIGAIAEGLTALFQDPVGTIQMLLNGLAEGLSAFLSTIFEPIIDGMAVAFKRVLPAWLGGYDREQKEALDQADVDKYIARAEAKTAEYEAKVASSVIEAASVSIYVASPDAIHIKEQASATSSTNSKTTNVTVINQAVPVLPKPGDHL